MPSSFCKLDCPRSTRQSLSSRRGEFERLGTDAAQTVCGQHEFITDFASH